MEDLPFLLKLCDDPSPAVREKVARRLCELGPQVWAEIEAQHLVLSPGQRAAIAAALQEKSAVSLPELWQEVWLETDPARQLENGLLILGNWQAGVDGVWHGRELLDALAAEFRASGASINATALADFLFEQKALSGAPPDDYYNPLHSNLVYVLEAGQGLPISLACVFILVGRRLGLSIEGCSFPGHFLARDARSATVFDPYNGGRALSRREVATLHKAAPDKMAVAASSREILTRVLRNLIVAYHQNGEAAHAQVMRELLQESEM